MTGDTVEVEVMPRDCGICGFEIAKSSWVTHHGKRCHASCYEKSGEQPDIVSGHGQHAPGGSCSCLDREAVPA